MHPDGVWIPILALVMVPFLVISIPIVRAITRKIDRAPSQSQLPTDVTLRLERMEQAIDSIAIEIERISEGQRFAYKLLSDKLTNTASTQIAPPS